MSDHDYTPGDLPMVQKCSLKTGNLSKIIKYSPEVMFYNGFIIRFSSFLSAVVIYFRLALV